MTELVDVATAFSYGDSLLVGDRVRLRPLLEDDVPTLAQWEMDPGRSVMLLDRVAPPSEAAAREKLAKWSANEGNELGFTIVAQDGPQPLVGHIIVFGIRAKDRSATVGIAIGREYLGRGYGTDAMRVIVGYGFRERVAPHSAERGAVQPGRDPGLREGRVHRGGPPARVGMARRPLVRRGADVRPGPRVGRPPRGPMS